MQNQICSFSTKKIKGLTLLETMFALALGVLVLIAIMLIYNGTKKSGAQSKVVSDVTAIVSGYQNYISSGQMQTRGKATIQNIQLAGYLAGSGGIIMDPYGKSYDATLNTNGTVTVVITGLPYSTDTNSQCMQIGGMLGQSGKKAGGILPTQKSNSCAYDMPL